VPERCFEFDTPGVDFTNAFRARFLQNVTRKKHLYEKRTRKMRAKTLVKSTPGLLHSALQIVSGTRTFCENRVFREILLFL